MGLKVSLNGVEPVKLAGGITLKPGVHRARIIGVKDIDHATPGIDVEFEVVDGECKGARKRDGVWLSEKALPYALGRFEATGVPLSQLVDADGNLDTALVAAKFKGKVVAITVVEEPYTDRDGNERMGTRIFTWDKPQGSGPSDLAPDLTGVPSGAAADDDIPF